MNFRSSLLRAIAGFAAGACACLAPAAWPQGGKVGIFDLDALHATPLQPEVVARSVADGVVTEAVRFTSVPGVRPLLILTYKDGLKGRPGSIFARRFGAEARTEEAKGGFVSVTVAPPSGNEDPTRLDAVGGPKYDPQLGFRQYYDSDPHQSWLYHHVVALTRAIDYLATRPEIDLAKTSVLGTEWPGVAVALLHAIDDRPAAYFVWNGVGFYADHEEKSGDVRARISRQAFEMYSPAAYAGQGSKPIYVANALNSDESRFDALFELAKGLKSPKVLAFAPNRERFETSQKEFAGSATWQAFWTNPFGEAPAIGDGSVKAADGKLRYECTASGQTGLVLLASYGKPGDWTGRNWHRLPMKKEGDRFVGEIPVYDPEVPVYVFAQAQTARYGTLANVPQLLAPSAYGISEANAVFPKELLRGDDFYVATGTYSAGPTGPNGRPSARILPHWDGRIRLRNVQPRMWKDAKELVVTVKGDGTPGVLNVYFAVESRDELDGDRENYTRVPLLKSEESLGTAWRTFTIPLDQVADLDRVDSLFFETGGKPLQIASLTWR
jgi:hypothetical protein